MKWKNGKRWKGCFFSSSQGPLSLEPSNGHQAWNLLMATKHWNLSLATKQDASPLTTKLRTSHWPPSKMLPHWPPSMEHFRGHQAWNLPLTTKFGFSLTSFLPLLLKNTNLDHLFFFLDVIFDLNIWKLVPTWYLTLFSQFEIWVVNVAWFWKFVQSFFSFFYGW
jgi:hypothetical protein